VVVRVSTDAGDDVNSFNFRVVDANGRVLNGTSWKVIAIDLSVGAYRSSSSTRYQIKPYLASSSASIPDLTVNGEEDSEVSKIDAFGELFPLQASQIPATKYGIENSWGIQIKGSEDWLNTLTVYGTNEPVLWEFEPIALSEYQKPELQVKEIDATQCSDKQFELSGSVFSNFELNNALWMLKNTQVAKGNSPTIAFEDRGRVPVDILVPNNRSYFPAYWTYTQVVFVNTSPVADIKAPKTIISPSEVLNLSAEDSYDPENQEISYTWFVNGSRRGTGPDFNFSNTISGLYTISVQVSDGETSANCSISEQQIDIRVNTQPYAEINVAPVSGTNEPITLTVANQTDSDNDILSFRWEGIGIPQNTTGTSVTVQQERPGVYPVRLTVNDGSGATNANYSINRVYEINAAPEPIFSIPENVAPGDVFSLNGVESTDPNRDPLAYTWLVNGSEVARGDISTLSLNEPGNYEVTLLVDDQRQVSNSVQRLSKTLRVNAAPLPVITAVPITSKANVEFAATQSRDQESEIASYQWEFGDGSRGSGPQVSHNFSRTGTYTVKLTVNDGAGLKNSIQSTEHVIVVNSFPIANMEAPDVVAPGEPFTVDASASSDSDGEITAYYWYANGAPSGTGVQNSITLNNPGLHTVSLSVNDDSGFDLARGFDSKQVRVNQSPIPRWRTEPEMIIPGKEVKFFADRSEDPDGNIETYIWKFEDGVEIRGEQIQRIFEDGGQKRFTLTAIDNDRLSNSSTTIEGVATVNHQPYIVTESLVRSNSLNVRLDASASYDLDNDPMTFTWTLPDGTKRNEAGFTWSAPKAGVHIIGLTVDDGLGLENSISKESVQVLVNRPVEAVVDSVITSCTGQTVLFNSSRSFDPDGDAFKVSWDFGNGVTSDEANPSYQYETPGVYEVRLTLNDGFTGESSVAKIPVIIEGSPVAKMNISDTTICVNTALMFDGSNSTDPSGSLPAMSWDMGDGNTATGAKYRHIFTEPGVYNVTLSVEGSGSGQCSNVSQATAKITVIEGPVAEFTLPEWSAPGEPVVLDGSSSSADGGFSSAQWIIDAEGKPSVELDGLTTTHTFNEPGEYFVTLNLVTNTQTDCNTVSLTRSIKVNAPPVIAWTLPENVAAGSDLKLDALSSNDPDGFIRQHKWYIDDGFVSYNASELVKAVTPGRHKVTLEITDNSLASNNRVTMEKYFFANSSPLPTIEGPAVVYQNQQVSLRSGLGEDKDGDRVSTRWMLDGEPLPSPVFIANEARTYTVTLIQDDGRGLSNSVDSTILEINPVKVPSINPNYPAKIAVGGTLTIDGLGLSNSWSFAQQDFYEQSWQATSASQTELNLAWTPLGQELARKNFPITVVPRLAFTEQSQPQVIEWNSLNPTTILIAPKVNREASSVEYIWKKGTQVIGRGIQISPTLVRGQNRFTVEVRDLNVAQSTPVSVDVIVTTQ
jgi:PKD repeat protein